MILEKSTDNQAQSNIEIISKRCGELTDRAKEQLLKWNQSLSKIKVYRNTWHEYFILQAFFVSTRSLDAQTKCGCVLVRDNTIIASGYNSFIGGINDSVLPNTRPDKYPFMIHAEHNAILNCSKNGISTKGSTAYITTIPCCGCLQYLYQAGIKDIYFAQYIKPSMVMNEEYETNFEILCNLMSSKRINIYELILKEQMIEKIEKIKSCG